MNNNETCILLRRGEEILKRESGSHPQEISEKGMYRVRCTKFVRVILHNEFRTSHVAHYPTYSVSFFDFFLTAPSVFAH